MYNLLHLSEQSVILLIQIHFAQTVGNRNVILQKQAENAIDGVRKQRSALMKMQTKGVNQIEKETAEILWSDNGGRGF